MKHLVWIDDKSETGKSLLQLIRSIANKESGTASVLDSAETEKAEWSRMAIASFSNAYGEDEPDYSNMIVKEPNPGYKS